jgi:hypothetical protein
MNEAEKAKLRAVVKAEFSKHTWDTFVDEPPSIVHGGASMRVSSRDAPHFFLDRARVRHQMPAYHFGAPFLGIAKSRYHSRTNENSSRPQPRPFTGCITALRRAFRRANSLRSRFLS